MEYMNLALVYIGLKLMCKQMLIIIKDMPAD